MNLTSWVEVDLEAISNNIKSIKSFIGKTRLMAVVKGDAYGHGLVPVSCCAVESGADYLGVATLEEGILLRKKGIIKPVLVFNTILPDQADIVVKNNLTATVCSFDVVQALDEAARKYNKNACVHVNVDTGFGRFGLLPEYVAEFINIVNMSFDCIFIEGIYTHFSSSVSETMTKRQFEKFKFVLDKLNNIGCHIPLRHACNSTATLMYPEMHMDMVRVGNLMYGLCEAGDMDIKSVAKVFSKVIFLKNLPSGHNVGYGNRFVTKRPTTIAVIPFGYYDGLELSVIQPNGIFDGFKSLIKQLLANFGYNNVQRKAKIKGKYCDIIGKIGMQNCIIDVTELKNEIFIGDLVELAMRKVNICYNIPRIYLKSGRTVVDTRMISISEDMKMVAEDKKRRETSIG